MNKRTSIRIGRAAVVVIVAAALQMVALAQEVEEITAPLASTQAEAADDFASIAATRVHFASVDEARAVLGAMDEWIPLCGAVQRDAITGVAGTSPEAFARWQADNVRPWPVADEARWRRALEQMAPAINRLRLPLPGTVLLVRTTGAESAQTPHTRANAIVIPAGLELGKFTDVELLAHEIFHIASRADPALASKLYRLVGFEPVGELQWPPGWVRIRIADPDAPHLNHAMRIKRGGRDRLLMPVVVASREHPNIAKAETIDDLMQTRLLEVQPDGSGQTVRPVLVGAQPVWSHVNKVPAYLLRLGGNTDYVLHPEETLADNFMLLVSGRPVPNPGLLRRIEQSLLHLPPVPPSGAASEPVREVDTVSPHSLQGTASDPH